MVESKREAWHEIAKRVEDTGADGVELNFGCPHGMSERGMGAAMGQVPEYTCMVTEWVKEATRLPVISSMLFKPSIRCAPLSSEARREQTLRIGSPSVFHTAPPQPASNARSIIEPMFVGGALASQNGFGDLMPAKSTARSAISFVPHTLCHA